jgi:hypothetical protein
MTRGRPTNAVMTEDHRPKDASASSSSEVCNGGEQDVKTTNKNINNKNNLAI